MSFNPRNVKTCDCADAPPPPLRIKTGKPLVLVVEEHDDSRFMLRTMLEWRGFEVVEATDGLEAIETAERERPNIILMDGTLPVLDGLAATRRIREYGLLREVPLIALSGYATLAYQAAAFAAGCSAYLVKPFAFEQLDKLMEQFLHTQPSSS